MKVETISAQPQFATKKKGRGEVTVRNGCQRAHAGDRAGVE